MLEIINIKKDYVMRDDTVQALKGVNICFRKNEFVSILGPSGCGKTTLLNIIGGLDRYTDGDLIIEGKSTKEFKDRDWDTYRNHSIGFVFQSYNLIPHQTALKNVELALSIGGVSRKERRQRALDALEKVGLSEQINKKPNQMSGGQCQRVAIARALVNNPEIILADEPTGALDSKTSVQVMDILKEIAKDRLVIMVTHNPELANQYSTRIITMKDGEVLSDTNPVKTQEKKKLIKDYEKRQQSMTEKEKRQKAKKSSMSLWSTFMLSGSNLLTKKKRTFITSLACSIGIIGIAVILSVSNGMHAYVKKIERDSMSVNYIA
ncbi:MAG: ABC transporter ATP-binding protein, partial [Clostridia bacterium]|nr:ABC transporter ATP-binding protein [Clostridia bacterium]